MLSVVAMITMATTDNMNIILPSNAKMDEWGQGGGVMGEDNS